MRIVGLGFLFLLSCTITQIHAALPNVPEIEKIGQSPEWRLLLHFRPQGLLGREYSEVDDERFFLAEDGKFNSISELSATIHALQSSDGADNAAQCRFPARYKFIKKVFPNLPIVENQCVTFNEWYQQVKGNQLHLIFPSSYISSPSSMYGHTLLRLDGMQGHQLLSSAINFAAFADETDDEFTYSYKGLTGGYPGYVSLMPYYDKVKTYSHIESRDIWEYKLKLSEDQIDTFVRHIWELDKIRFDYFFIDENCSYRILTLLDVMNPEWQLSARFKFRAVPSDTIRVLFEKDLVEDIKYRPSKTTLIENQRKQLSEPLRVLTRHLADDPFRMAVDERYLVLETEDKAKVLELAYDYTRYLALKKKDRDPELPKKSLKLLSLRAGTQYQGSAFLPPSDPAVRDEEGHDTLKTTFSLSKDFAEIGFRLNYHGWMDIVQGYREGAQIEMGEWVIQANDDTFRLKEFDVIDIRSVGPRHELSHPISWQVKTGYERWDVDGMGQVHLRAGAGYAYPMGSGVLYGMAVSQIAQSQRFSESWRFGYGPEFGYLIQQNRFNAWISLERLASMVSTGASRLAQMSIAYNLSARDQLRFQIQHQDWQRKSDQNIRLSYVFYH